MRDSGLSGFNSKHVAASWKSRKKERKFYCGACSQK